MVNNNRPGPDPINGPKTLDQPLQTNNSFIAQPLSGVLIGPTRHSPYLCCASGITAIGKTFNVFCYDAIVRHSLHWSKKMLTMLSLNLIKKLYLFSILLACAHYTNDNFKNLYFVFVHYDFIYLTSSHI